MSIETRPESTPYDGDPRHYAVPTECISYCEIPELMLRISQLIPLIRHCDVRTIRYDWLLRTRIDGTGGEAEGWPKVRRLRDGGLGS